MTQEAGIKDKNPTLLGVPRIKELIDCTKNPRMPSMSLTVLPSYSGPEALERLRLSLVETPLSRAVLSADFLDEPDFFRTELGGVDAELVARERLLALAPPGAYGALVARLVLDPTVLVPRGLAPSDVGDLLERHCACHVSAAEELHEPWLLRVRFVQLARGTTGLPEAQEALRLRSLTEELVHRLCREVLLGGLSGVQSAAAQREVALGLGPEGAELRDCAAIGTQGTSLAAALSLPQLQASRCCSNDVHEVLAVLGVEAATALLFEQIQFTLQFDGSYVNERHLMLLVSFMTCLGGLLPVSRHGINKLADSGPLARASFEEVSDRLAESAAFGDVDPVLCHSSRIMIGETCRVGTGACEIEHEDDGEASGGESDDVVFTTMDVQDGEAPEPLSYGVARGAPIEMPFSEESPELPKAVQHAAYLHLVPSALRAYAPSSPKNLAQLRKRHYEPSSPKTAKRPRE